MAADRRLIAALRAGLAGAADPSRALGMQSYMKSAMPYYGVPAPVLKKVTRAVFDAHPLTSEPRWRDTVLALWRRATFREERYAAIALTGHKLYRGYQTPDALDVYEEMIVDGAWWDYVDDVSIHRVGPLLGAHWDDIEPVMRRWSRDGDTWRRRCSIICQISFRGEVDTGLLYDCIEPNLADREFFIRKAIGWALRSYAWHNPDEVIRYVSQNRERLSPLSRREALKNLKVGS